MKEYKFDPVRATEECAEWIRNWFEKNGKGCRAVVGISGGKDSSIVAALCVKALGKDRVFGVLMPRGEQFDISCSHQLVNHLGIEHAVVNIKETADAMDRAVGEALGKNLTPQSLQNIPPRIRMTTLYAVSQSVNGRVANTCNFSEDWVGYSTRYGDSAGDFSPISCFTVTELKQIGRCLGLPVELVDKTPIDGLCGKTDEDNLGFTYAELDRYIREGIEPCPEKKALIDRKHEINLFKLRYMDCFVYEEKMKNYKAVIMDFDMTIADTGDLIEECLYTNAARYGYDLDRRILREGIGMTAEAIYRGFGIGEAEAKKLHDEYIPYSAEAMRERTEFFSGVAEGLASLHSKGVLLSILSLKASDQIWRPLERAGMDKLIDRVIGPDEVAAHKPDPAGIYFISEKTGIALADILYVGDSVTDMKTAENAGVDFAAVCTGAISKEEFAEMGARMVYPTFAEMCGALSNMFAQS